MPRYYECHITMEGAPESIRPDVERLKWKFSNIDGDPVLGKGVKCYATKLFNQKIDSEDVLSLLRETARRLAEKGHKVLRRKVEVVIFDDRSVKVNCEGGCVECHLDDLAPCK